MAKKVKTAIPNWKRKKWYELVSSATFGDKSLGETFAFGPEDLMGKTVEINVMSLTGNAKKQNFSMKFRVVKVVQNKGITRPITLKMLPSSIRRLIRAGKERVDASFVAKSKDDVLLRVKPLIITQNKTVNSVLRDLQAKAKEFVTAYVESNNYETAFDAAVRGNLQKDLKDALNKVFPVKMVEIRMIDTELTDGVRVLPESAKEE